jgi:hypothetical protein
MNACDALAASHPTRGAIGEDQPETGRVVGVGVDPTDTQVQRGTSHVPAMKSCGARLGYRTRSRTIAVKTMITHKTSGAASRTDCGSNSTRDQPDPESGRPAWTRT